MILYQFKDSDEVLEYQLNPFFLDLYKGYELIKNQSFKEFWKAVDDFENLMTIQGGIDNLNVQEHVEKQIHGEDERQAVRMQEMMN